MEKHKHLLFLCEKYFMYWAIECKEVHIRQTGGIAGRGVVGIQGDRRTADTIYERQTLDVGAIIDRYGNPNGKYTSPVGVPYEQRALPYMKILMLIINMNYHQQSRN